MAAVIQLQKGTNRLNLNTFLEGAASWRARRESDEEKSLSLPSLEQLLSEGQTGVAVRLELWRADCGPHELRSAGSRHAYATRTYGQLVL